MSDRRSAIELSPCIGICRIDPLSGLCDGCRRTLEEIAVWGSLDRRTRERIMHDLLRRAPRPAVGDDGGEGGVQPSPVPGD